jgi:SAM-dependent methyltransferase
LSTPPWQTLTWFEGVAVGSRLLLAVAWTPEFIEAQEFQWLQRWVRSQAERTWDEVVLVENLQSTMLDASLLVVGERCLLGQRSMVAMRRLVAERDVAAVPRRLASSGLPDLDRIRTLRGLERAEGLVLASSGGEGAQPLPPYPAVLLPPDAVSQLRFESPAKILRGDGFESEAASVGLCHEFIDYYGELREDILPFLDADCHEMLDIGCGRGATGAFLQERLGCRVTGVELNPVVARAAARRLHRVIAGDILQIDPGGPYDAVVASELFEHLTEQGLFLQRLRRWLRPGGRAVLSVPNVNHYSIIEDLIAGRWDYLPVGILCSTHYRFFTRHTLEDILRAAEFADFEIVPQMTEPPPWLAALPTDFEIDTEGLSTSGFHVVIRNE